VITRPSDYFVCDYFTLFTLLAEFNGCRCMIKLEWIKYLSRAELTSHL